MARQLVTEKATLRAAEFAAAESHLARLREGAGGRAWSPVRLHLDILRDLETHPFTYLLGGLSGARARGVELQPSRFEGSRPGFESCGCRGIPQHRRHHLSDD